MPKGILRIKKIIELKPLHYILFSIFFVLSLVGGYFSDNFNWSKFLEGEVVEPQVLGVSAPNVLSFQGRMTDRSDTPITAPVSVTFKIYNVSTGGTALWTGTCSITPDQDGIFETMLGSVCGSAIPDTVFSDNQDTYLGITVGTDSEMTPRQNVAASAYALNADTLDGFDSSQTPGASNVVVLDTSGNLAFGVANPVISSSADIVLSPVENLGVGTTNPLFRTHIVQQGVTAEGSSVITGGDTGRALVIQGSGGAFISGRDVTNDVEYVLGTASGTSVFMGSATAHNVYFRTNNSDRMVIQSTNGYVGIGDLTPASLFTVGAGDLFQINSSGDIVTIKGVTYSWPSSNTAGVLVNNGSGVLTWQTVATGSTAWDDILDPDSNSVIVHGAYSTDMQFDTFTSGSAFKISSAATGLTGSLLDVSLTGSNAANTGNLLVLNNTGRANTNTSFLINHFATGTNNLAFRVNDVSGDTTPFVIDGAGNVGIGTTAPTEKLDVSGNARVQGNILSLTGNIGRISLPYSWGLYEESHRYYNVWHSWTAEYGTYMYLQAVDGQERLTISESKGFLFENGNLGIGITSPTATLHFKAGTATAGTAPLKFTTGVNLTTAESGAMEWDGSRLYMTNTTPTRNTLAYLSDLSSFITQGYQIVQEDASSLTQRSILNFVGSGITATDDATNTRTNISLGSKLNAFADLVSADGVLTNTSGTLSWTPSTVDTDDQRWDEIFNPSANKTFTMGSYNTDFQYNTFTSGSAYKLSSTSTAFTGSLGDITLSGSNAANTGSLLALNNTGTLNTNTSFLINHFATGTGNLALRVNDVSGDTTPFVIDGGGKVGVGTSTPSTLLNINQSVAGTPAIFRADSYYAGAYSTTDVLVASSIGDSYRSYVAKIQVQRDSYLGQGWNFIVTGGGGTIFEAMRLSTSGKLGIGVSSPTGVLHLKAGTASAETAPLKFTAGTNLTVAESGAMEWDGSRLYMTDTTPTRNTLAYLTDIPAGATYWTRSGSTLYPTTSGDSVLPNGTAYLGSDTSRWADIFLSSSTLHFGTSITDEGLISYDTTNNIFKFDTDSTTNGDISFFTDDIYLDKSTGSIGIGTTSPLTQLHITGELRAPIINKVVIVDGTTFPQSCAGINSALSSLPSSGGEIFLPAGTYTCSETIVIKSDNTTIRGVGEASHINGSSMPAGSGLIFFTEGYDQVVIRDLKITGNRGSSATGDHAIFAGWPGRACNDTDCSTNYSLFENLTIVNAGDWGIQLRYSDNSVIQNNTFTNCGFYVWDNSNNNTIADNKITNAESTIGTYGNETYNKIVNNLFLGGPTAISTLLSIYSIRSFISENVFSGESYGVSLAGGSNIFTNNQLINSSYRHLTLLGSNHIVDHNYFEDDGTTRQAIALSTSATSSNVKITNNSFKGFTLAGSTDYGIAIKLTSFASNYIIANNSFGDSRINIQENTGTVANYVYSDEGKFSIGAVNPEPDAVMEIVKRSGDSTPLLAVSSSADGNGDYLTIDNNGSIRISSFGAGTVISDASGNLSVSSDENLKDIKGDFTKGLNEILQLNPILYNWNELSQMDMLNTYAGFSAQNVQLAIPEAVGVDMNGFLSLSDRPILAATVNAIKEQQKLISRLTSNISTLSGTQIHSMNITEENIRFNAELKTLEYSNDGIQWYTFANNQSLILLSSKVDNLETRISTLEQISSRTDSNTLNILKVKLNSEGNIELLGGNILMEGDGTLSIKKLKLEENYSIGSSKILANITSIVIKTKAITTDSKVFINPTSDTLNKVLYVTELKVGESFKVNINGVLPQDITFDWFIIDSKKPLETIPEIVQPTVEPTPVIPEPVIEPTPIVEPTPEPPVETEVPIVTPEIPTEETVTP